MTPATDPESAARSVLDRLGIAEDPLVGADPVSFLRSLAAAGVALVKNPAGIAAANARLVIGRRRGRTRGRARAVGGETSGPVSPAAGDKRFTDLAYAENPLYFLLEQQYLLAGQAGHRAARRGRAGSRQDAKARFAAKFMLDALAPTNTLPGNPAALRQAFDTGGKSLVRGAKNMLGDIRHNGGWPSQVDSSGFEVGVNMAATPGEGRLPQRPDRADPVRAPRQAGARGAAAVLPAVDQQVLHHGSRSRKSLIEWAVQHGHTCFAISYRNPDASMRDLGFEDYLLQGPLDAVRVVREITGAPEVNTLSVCLGGTLTAIGLAHNAAIGDDSIKSATFLNTHTDFSAPACSASSPTRPRSPASRSRWPRRATSTPTRWRTPSTRCGPTTWSSPTS